ncbi:hypothetical protein PT974_05704 [Cladobotryum mycophilum]|uniref:Uncharacterized protein n=1 Tax=Cladobotryum mycophilum TaxID=491253 RepID=A0ABR0SJH8_9HYPO
MPSFAGVITRRYPRDELERERFTQMIKKREHPVFYLNPDLVAVFAANNMWRSRKHRVTNMNGAKRFQRPKPNNRQKPKARDPRHDRPALDLYVPSAVHYTWWLAAPSR